ncbi:replication protein A 70 kDa DNA-binding subunit C [Trifolium repens]|nr:replication protein A 70 kDa DNA-binding subunit C [Trifolium repens]
MSRLFDMLGVLYPRREPWRIKVRVISLWTVNSVFRSNQVNSLDMVLIDEKGDKIQASICSFGADYCYLIDVIGVVTGITIEREYIHDAKMTRMIILELTDHSGKVECVLFGEYVRLFQELIAENNGKLPVIVIQFGKVKLFRDKVSIQNVDFATRIYFDPPTQDVLAFKNGISLHQVNYGVDISLIDPPNTCVKYFLHMVPRYRVKVNVEDATGQAVFVLFELDMYNLIDKKCAELYLNDRVEDDGSYPLEFDLLLGLKLLFQVEKGLTSDIQLDGSYRVKRVCDHEIIVAKFDVGSFDNSGGSRIVVRIPDEAHFQTVVDPKEKLISVPWSFVEVWKRANLPHCGVKISSGGKSINARFCVSDDAFMFYADKVAEFFGFAEPTRVTMTYILSENTFFLDVVGDPGTEESSNENEIVSLTSSGDESDYDEGDDQLNDYQNQQMIVYNEDVNAHYETFHTVTWSKTVTESMAAYRSKQSLHFMKFICRRFLQNQHIMLLKCEETGFSYMCKVESSKKADEHGVFLKRIGEGWYKFRDEHKLKVGDNLWFEMSFYPYVLKVWIDRKK